MKPRPPSEDDDGGLDSLMDTMTNVVGILVLVLVMTQLDMQEAVRQITSKSNVTAADVEAMKNQIQAAQAEQEKIQETAASLASFDIHAERERLKRLQEMLAAKKKLLKTESEQANQFSLALSNDRKMAAEKEKEIQANEQQREELKTAMTDLLSKQADLKAMLDKTPRRAAAPPKVVSIPNPRPAPSGAKQLSFLCANNRLYPMSIDELRAMAEQKSKEIIVRHRLGQDPAVGIDAETFEKFYTKLSYPTDDFLNVEFYVADHRWPRLRLTPKEDRGATDEELQKPRSRMHRLLAGLDPEKFFAVFYVLPDSYDVYITARQIMLDAGVQAGWDPVAQNWIYTTSVPGGIELGPPRPKDPNPPPAPPAKPANVID